MRARRLAWIAVLAGAILWGRPASASAPERARVVVLPPSVAGELSKPQQTELLQAVRDGLARGDFELVSPPEGLTPCKTQECAAQVARGAGADYAVMMSVSVERRDYEIALDLVDSTSSQSAAHSEKRCEVCGIAEAREIVDGQAAALRDRLEALAREAPTVAFESTPTGAIVRLDGTVVGETPFSRPVEPGPHRAEAAKSGYVDEAREFEAVAGVGSTVRFELDAVPRTVRFKKLRTFGWAALGIGTAAVITGVTLIAIDAKPNTTNCDGENVDPLGNCKFRYATLEAGIGVGVIGVALLATGIGIALGTRDRRRKSKVSIGPRGVAVSGRF